MNEKIKILVILYILATTNTCFKCPVQLQQPNASRVLIQKNLYARVQIKHRVRLTDTLICDPAAPKL
jgi:hypothetical protein